MSHTNRQFIIASLLISLLCLVDVSAISLLIRQDTSVFSTSTRLRIPLKTTTYGMQGASVLLVSPHAPDENVHGLAQIRPIGAFIIVTLSLSDLAPKTTYLASLHAGNCVLQGPVVFPLQSLITDAQGSAMSITTLNVHTLRTTHLSITIDKTNTTTVMKRPQGFTSIACGDVNIH